MKSPLETYKAALEETGDQFAAAVVTLAKVLAESAPRETIRKEPLNPPDIAKRLRVSPSKVIGWIRSGQLKASNIATGKRPRFIVQPTDLETFLKCRQPDPPLARRPRKPKSDSADRY